MHEIVQLTSFCEILIYKNGNIIKASVDNILKKWKILLKYN